MTTPKLVAPQARIVPADSSPTVGALGRSPLGRSHQGWTIQRISCPFVPRRDWYCHVMSVTEAPARRPDIGVVAGWFDPDRPLIWSGVPHSILREVRGLARVRCTQSATPYVVPAKVVHRLRFSRRLGSTGSRTLWTLTPEMRVLSRITALGRCLRTPADVDAWLHLCGAYGRFVRGRYVTLGEISPSRMVEQLRWAGSFGYPGASRKQLEWVGRRHIEVYRNAYACCAASRWIADDLIRDGVNHAKIRIVGYGSNHGLTAPDERDWSRPRFLFVGWDWERKNGDAVARAFLSLRQRVPEATLDVVGYHPPLDLPGVTGHGPLSVFDPDSKAALERLFLQSTCFVMPSFVEPFGIVYVEAATAGIPSIGTTIGGTSESIGAGGVCVDPEDHNALFRAMLELSDPATASALGRIANRRVARLTWRATAERILRSADLSWSEPVELADFL